MPNKSPFFFGDSLPQRKSFDTGLSFITNTNRSWLDDYHDYGGPINYTREAGRLDHNAIVMACIGFAKRAFPEAPIQVLKRTPDGPVPQVEHALTQLVMNPNPYYNGILLWRSTIASMILSGNGYWLKVRNGSGRVMELWYEPHTTIRPVGTSEEFISHYEVYRYGRSLQGRPRPRQPPAGPVRPCGSPARGVHRQRGGCVLGHCAAQYRHGAVRPVAKG
jgi:hypothetical protein